MATDTPHHLPPIYLRFLPSFVFEPDSSPFRYVSRALLLSILPAIAITAILAMLFPSAASAPSRDVSHVAVVLGVVVIAPILETALLGAILLILQRFVGPAPSVVVSSILWGILHGSVAARWGIAMSWSFLIFSMAFATWQRVGVLKGFGVSFTIHALQNGIAVVFLFALGAL